MTSQYRHYSHHDESVDINRENFGLEKTQSRSQHFLSLIKVSLLIRMKILVLSFSAACRWICVTGEDIDKPARLSFSYSLDLLLISIKQIQIEISEMAIGCLPYSIISERTSNSFQSTCHFYSSTLLFHPELTYWVGFGSEYSVSQEYTKIL